MTGAFRWGRDQEDDDLGSNADAPLDAPPDRFCDIVMEGGVTSGVIYASAVAVLARHYRFRNIGGSSIGAFAAALTAAAEFRRRHGYGDGFAALARLPSELAKVEDKRTLLERLFVPQASTQRLFRIFLAGLERSGPLSVCFHTVREAVRQYEKRVLITAVVFALVAAPGIAGVLLAAVVGGLSALLFGISADFSKGVVPNGFGLCRGWEEGAKSDRLDLASFLHMSIQRVAGRRADEHPLTFRELWEAPGSPSKVLGLPVPPDGERSINLQVYASNLSHGRPYRFPLESSEDTARLFFRREELERYFPLAIVQFVESFARRYAPRTEADPPKDAIGREYLELPLEDLPIVVAARLAMSFPVLISAIPLYAIDYAEQKMARCWMSDGGLCSNFPIHLFDSFLPMWPTFGISLNERSGAGNRRVWLPRYHTSGRADSWDHSLERSSWRLASFLRSLWKTAWAWNDSTMMRMPGVRDRVVRVYLEKGEGGVNIRMGTKKIEDLGNIYGVQAAREFVRKFATEGSPGWDEHRWVRMNDLMIALRERIFNFSAAVKLDRYTRNLYEQIGQAGKMAPLRRPSRREVKSAWPSEVPLQKDQVAELHSLVVALCALEKAFKAASPTKPYEAVPRPSLRMRHPT